MSAAAPSDRPGRLAAAYVALAFAFAGHSLWALWRIAPQLADRRTARLIGGTVLATWLILAPYSALAIAPEADEPHYLVLAQSIVRDGDLDLRNNYQPRRYRAFYPGRLRDIHAIVAGPRFLPIRDLGLPLVAALPYGLARRPGVLIVLAAIAALAVAQIFLLLRTLAFTPRVAVAAAGVAALTHPLSSYAAQIYPETLVLLAGVTAVRLMRSGRALSLRDAALAGACIAVLPWFTTRAWFFAIGLAVCLLFFGIQAVRGTIGSRVRTAGRFAAAALPGLAIVAALLALNWRLFGVPIPGAGFYLVSDQQKVLSGTPQLGAVGLLFDRVFGLVPRAPLYLLAFVGVGALIARSRPNTTVLWPLVIGWTFHFAFIASLEHWHSDWAPPARNLVATLPLLVVALAAGLEALGRARHGRSVMLGSVLTLSAASVVIAFVYRAYPWIQYNLADRLRATHGTGILWRALRDMLNGVDVGRVFPSIIQESSTMAPLALAWLTFGVALAYVGWRATRHIRAAPQPAY